MQLSFLALLALAAVSSTFAHGHLYAVQVDNARVPGPSIGRRNINEATLSRVKPGEVQGSVASGNEAGLRFRHSAKFRPVQHIHQHVQVQDHRDVEDHVAEPTSPNEHEHEHLEKRKKKKHHKGGKAKKHHKGGKAKKHHKGGRK